MERNWLVAFTKNGFEAKMVVRGTEPELWEYMRSEGFGGDERTTGDYRYHACGEEELEAVRLLGMKIYLAPTCGR